MCRTRILVGYPKSSAEHVRIDKSLICRAYELHRYIPLYVADYLCSVRKFINDENWYLRLNRARHLEPHARFVKPACIHSRQMDIPQSPSDASEDPQLALYVRSKPSISIPTLTSIPIRLPTLVFLLINQVSFFRTVLTHPSSTGIHTAT